jgi:hypothetical protein
MVILVGLTAKCAFRFLVNVFGFFLDNLDPFNPFPLNEPIESNPTRNYDLFSNLSALSGRLD